MCVCVCVCVCVRACSSHQMTKFKVDFFQQLMDHTLQSAKNRFQ